MKEILETLRSIPTADRAKIHDTSAVVEAVKNHVEGVYGAGSFGPTAQSWVAFACRLGVALPQIVAFVMTLVSPPAPPSGPQSEAAAGSASALEVFGGQGQSQGQGEGQSEAQPAAEPQGQAERPAGA